MKWTGCLEFCREFFITLSNFLYIYNLVPRVTSAAFLVVSGGSPMWRHPSRLSARIRQEHVPKNGHPKWRRWFSYHNTSKDNGHHFSLLTISKTVHKCSEGIYLNLKCSRSTFVEQLWEFFSSRSGTFGSLLVLLLLLLLFFPGIALSFLDPSLYPLTWIAQIDVGQLMGYGLLILFCLS